MNGMQTSALYEDEADMFGAAEPAPAVQADDGVLLEIDGVLIEDAQVRNKLVDHGTQVRPVLWLNLRPLSGGRRSMHVEQIYTEATRKEAEAKAATLRKGARVTFVTPVIDMHTVFPHVRSVALTPG